MPKPKRDNPALKLAARIRAAATRRDAARRAEEEARKERIAQISAALDRLFDHLEEAGRAAEVLHVKRKGRSIEFKLEGRSIRIASKASKEKPDHLEVTASGIDGRLTGFYREEIDRWALRIERTVPEGEPTPKPEVLVLLGAGLAILVEECLGLPLGDEEMEEE
jgi:hypothetical protein